MKNVLIIDNDIEFTELLSNFLKPNGFNVTSACDGETGIKKALNQSAHIIILDIVLPVKNGFEVLKTIREHSNTPVLILTAKDTDINKLVALELGADDFLIKPCNPRELIAKLNAILKRMPKSPTSRPVMEYLDLTVDSTKRQVLMKGIDLELTNTEFNILEMLIKSPGQAFSKEELTEYAMGRPFTAFDRSIDVHISNLRNKLGKNASGEAWLKTVRGYGYIFNIPT